jgi:hypothetical protein
MLVAEFGFKGYKKKEGATRSGDNGGRGREKRKEEKKRAACVRAGVLRVDPLVGSTLVAASSARTIRAPPDPHPGSDGGGHGPGGKKGGERGPAQQQQQQADDANGPCGHSVRKGKRERERGDGEEKIAAEPWKCDPSVVSCLSVFYLVSSSMAAGFSR